VNDGKADRAVTKLPGTEAAVPAARRFTSQAITDRGLNGETIEKAELLVTELATNSVLHAHSPIRLSVLGCTRHAVRVEVRDDDPAPLRTPCRPEVDAEHGRGLWLVAALADAWGVNSNEKGKTVWFEVG
jgi:anti-sigma regulatory factor (Ser/Thr protein kinase)